MEPAHPVRRYERNRPGERLHIDIKKPARFDHVDHHIAGNHVGQSNSRGVGWECVHVCIDDPSRVGLARTLPDEIRASAVAILKFAVAFSNACKHLRFKHSGTKPDTTKTNRKAKHFIQTAIREWPYAPAYQNSDQHTQHLPDGHHPYNWHSPRANLKKAINRIGPFEDSLLRFHT